MSSESSIVVKMTDRYSNAVKSMSKTTKSLTKDVDGLEKTLYELTQNKAELKIDLKQAKDQLREAEARFKATGDEADRLRVMFAHVQVDNFTRNLKTVNGALTETEKRISTVQNKAGGSGGFFGALAGLKDDYRNLQYAQMYGQAIGQLGNTLLTSGFGSTTTGTVLSGMASGAASGAAIGFSVGGPVGAAAGALIGLGAGAISGITQDYENKDDFFKDYYQGLYEERQEAGQTALEGGSTTAGSREQSYKAFAKRLGGEAEADAYLADVKHMASSTNYDYDEILGYSQQLLNSYKPEETLTLLGTLSDATAGLNLSSSGVSLWISGLSRMRTTNKTTQEYLNYFSERGVDVYEALAEKLQLASAWRKVYCAR